MLSLSPFRRQPANSARAVVFPALLALFLCAGCGRYVPGTIPATTALSADAAWDGEAAISPDGKSVAFVSDRSDNVPGLWVRSADGKGDARQLATPPGEVSRPSWARDGKSILFTLTVAGHARPYVAEAAGSGEATPLALGEQSRDLRDLVRALDGSFAGIARTDSSAAVVAVSSTGTVRPLFDAGAAGSPSHPTWGQGGVAYAFAGDLWWVPVAGGSPVRLTSTANAHEADPEFSPNGKWLAFTSDSSGAANVWVARFDDKKMQLGPWRPASAAFQPNGHPAWSPNGRTLWFERQKPWTIVAMDANAANADTLSSSLWDSREPSFLGDDTRVAFSSPRTGPWRIWMMAAAGEARSGPAKQLTQGPRADVDPDACDATNQVAYVDRNDALGTSTLVLTDPEATPLGALTTVALGEPTRDEDPAWSPDGRSVAFASNRGGIPAIWVIEGVGRRVRMVTTGEGRVRTPRWSRDGATIYYTARGANGDVLYSVPSAGGASTALTEAGRGEEDDEPAPSPDGTQVVFTRRHRGDRDLMVLVNGQVRPLIADPRGQDAHANWSSDGRRIVFETGGAVDLCRADVRPLLLP